MFLSIIALLGFLIYKNETTPKDNNEDNNIEINEPISEEEIYIDDNPIIVGLYKNYKDGKKRKLITEYTSNWEYHKDISSFEVYYTQDEEISNSSQIKSFDYYKDKYENIDNYKIGYIVSFNTNDKETPANTSKTIIVITNAIKVIPFSLILAIYSPFL